VSTDPATPGTPPTSPPADAAPGAPGATPPAHAAPPADPNQPDWAPFTRVAVIAAIVGWAVFAIAGFANLGAAGNEHKHEAQARFFVGYLSGYIFWFSLPLGAMALLMMRYLAKTSWGLLLTRPFEAATRTLPLMFVLFIPLVIAVFAGEVSPYWWSNPHAEKPKESTDQTMPRTSKEGEKDKGTDKRDQAVKAGQVLTNRAYDALQKDIENAKNDEEREIASGNNHFLTPTAFVAVGLVLFGIWGLLILYLNKWGQAATDPDPRVVDRNLEKLSNISGPGLIIYAITTTVAASQWVMSLEAGWASTMFPVIYAVNQFLTCLTFCVSLFLLLAGRPPFKSLVRPKFQLDMGTLTLALTLFWSYTSFSQFMLVWIGNLPEEIPFFLKRSNMDGHMSGWWYVSAALIALHFALPFLLLLFRNIKLHPVRLRIVATYIAIICMVDVVWWIAPSAPQHGNFPTWLIDAGAVLGVGGVWGLFFLYHLKQRPLFPDNQAFLLPEGHHHEHH
jgi:hypothetical protein